MSAVSIYLYNLTSCGAHPSILAVATAVNPSPFVGSVVYISGQPQSEFYTVDPVTPPADGLNAGLYTGWMPPLVANNLISCADTNADKMYRITNCNDSKDTRRVLLVAAQTIGDVLRFTGECTCWIVTELISTYTETPTIDTTFTNCLDCLVDVQAELCTYSARTIGRVIKVSLPKPEPPNRGFAECCYSNLVFGDLVDTASYKNDFSSVFFQRQTSTDTVVFEIIPASTGVPVPLADVTHGELYPISATHNNPNLTWFRVDWRKILSTLGEDVFTIRKVVTVAGVGPTNIDSNSFILKPFSVSRADNTVRLDGDMEGKMGRINVDFKQSGYKTALRVQGYFGDAQDALTQDMVVFSNKGGREYFSSQITMSNDPEYTYQANNIPECISREIRKFIVFSNELRVSDYNLNNHSYEYELFPVEISEISPNVYPIEGRGVHMNFTMKERYKDNRKTNC